MRSRSYPGAYLRRQRARLGAPNAIMATAHKLARIFYTVMRYGVPCQKQSEHAFEWSIANDWKRTADARLVNSVTS